MTPGLWAGSVVESWVTSNKHLFFFLGGFGESTIYDLHRVHKTDHPIPLLTVHLWLKVSICEVHVPC